MQTLNYTFFLCLTITLCYYAVHACHSSQHERKKRQTAEDNNISVDETEILRRYFSLCLQDSVGELWDWNSVVDVTILDTFWYENGDTSNCSSSDGDDSTVCWIGRLREYFKENSFLNDPTQECILQYAQDTRDGTAREFASRDPVSRQGGVIQPTMQMTNIMNERLCTPAGSEPYFPFSEVVQQYTACNNREVALPDNRMAVDYPSVFQFVQGHTVCGPEFPDCNSEGMESITSDPEVPRWPYRLEALTKTTSPLQASFLACNNIVFPTESMRASEEGEWGEWSECSKSCGGGTSTRSRVCPSSDSSCNEEETEQCNDELCPECQISLFSRQLCGDRNMGAAQCQAAGCCFDQNVCYRAGSTEDQFGGGDTFVPTINPEVSFGGEDGYPGTSIKRTCDLANIGNICGQAAFMTAENCVRSFCCWSALLGTCYHPNYEVITVRDDCAPGFENPPRCDDINDCIDVDCGVGRKCVDEVLGHRCVCIDPLADEDCVVSVSCTNPPSLLNGFIVNPLPIYSPGVSVNYMCSPGYDIVGAYSIQCLPSGNFPVLDGFCMATTTEPSTTLCTNPPTLLNGDFTSDVYPPYPVGAVLSYFCLSTPVTRISGLVTTSQCLSSGEFSEMDAACILACPSPPTSSDTGFEPVLPATGPDYFPVGVGVFDGPDSIMYSCFNGQPVLGSNLINTCSSPSNTLSGVWSQASPITCQLGFCPNPPPGITGGSFVPIQGGYVPGDSITYQCPSPMVVSGSLTNLCGETFLWSDSSERSCVDPIGCGDPPTIIGGTISPGGPYDINAMITYSCPFGFSVSGGSSGNLCMNALPVWAEINMRICVRIVCDRPTVLVNGLITDDLSEYSVGMMVTHSCASTHTLVDSSNMEIANIVRTCLISGMFDPLPAGVRCRAVCLRPTVTNGMIGDNQAQYNEGDTITITCSGDFQLVNSLGESLPGVDLQCLSTGFFENLPAGVGCRPGCGNPPGIIMGFISREPPYDIGETINYFCSSGFQIETGSTENTCLSGPVWSDPTPDPRLCSMITCPAPVLANGGFVPFQEQHNYMESILFFCDPGFVLQGTVNSICGNGVFEPLDQQCIRECSSPPTNSMVTFTPQPTYLVGDQITYTCMDINRSIVGNNQINMCMANGLWSLTVAPMCSPDMDVFFVLDSTNGLDRCMSLSLSTEPPYRPGDPDFTASNFPNFFQQKTAVLGLIDMLNTGVDKTRVGILVHNDFMCLSNDVVKQLSTSGSVPPTFSQLITNIPYECGQDDIVTAIGCPLEVGFLGAEDRPTAPNIVVIILVDLNDLASGEGFADLVLSNTELLLGILAIPRTHPQYMSQSTEYASVLCPGVPCILGSIYDTPAMLFNEYEIAAASTVP